MYDELSIKPSFHINSKQFPDIKKMEIGEEYELIVRVKVKAVFDEGHGFSASVEVNDIAIPAPSEEDIATMSVGEFTKFASKKKKEF